MVKLLRVATVFVREDYKLNERISLKKALAERKIITF